MAQKKHQFVFANNRGEFWTDERVYITRLHTCDASPKTSAGWSALQSYLNA